MVGVVLNAEGHQLENDGKELRRLAALLAAQVKFNHSLASGRLLGAAATIDQRCRQNGLR